MSRSSETNLIEMQSNHPCSHPDGRLQPQLVFDKVGENEIVLWQLPGNLEVVPPIMLANFINDICITDTILISCSYMSLVMRKLFISFAVPFPIFVEVENIIFLNTKGLL